MIEQALKCYHITGDHDDDDPRKLHIPELEGHRVVEGPELEAQDYTQLVKIKKVNTDSKGNLKFVNI